MREVQEMQDHRELTVYLVFKVFQEIKDPQARPVTQGSRDLRVLVVPLVGPVRQVTPAHPGLKDHRGLLELQVTQDQLDKVVLKVHPGRWELQGRQGPQGPLDEQGVRVLRVCRDHRVTLDLQDQLERSVRSVPSVNQGSPVQMVSRATWEILELLDLLELMGLRATQDLKDHKVLQDSQDLTEPQVDLVSRVLKDNQEVVDQLGLRELQDLQAL